MGWSPSCSRLPRALPLWITLALAVQVGYLAGVVAICLRLRASEGSPELFFANPDAGNLLVFRYHYWQQDAPLLMNSLATVLMALAIMVWAWLCRFAAEHASLWLAPVPILATQEFEIRPLWRAALRFSAPKWLFLAFWGTLAGLSAALFGELVATVSNLVSFQSSYMVGGTGLFPRARPRLWFLAGPDLAWLLVSTLILSGGTTVVLARRNLLNSGQLAARWCFACGYPRPAPTLPFINKPCTECGALSRPSRPSRFLFPLLRTFGYGLLAAILLASAFMPRWLHTMWL